MECRFACLIAFALLLPIGELSSQEKQPPPPRGEAAPDSKKIADDGVGESAMTKEEKEKLTAFLQKIKAKMGTSKAVRAKVALVFSDSFEDAEVAQSGQGMVMAKGDAVDRVLWKIGEEKSVRIGGGITTVANPKEKTADRYQKGSPASLAAWSLGFPLFLQGAIEKDFDISYRDYESRLPRPPTDKEMANPNSTDALKRDERIVSPEKVPPTIPEQLAQNVMTLSLIPKGPAAKKAWRHIGVSISTETLTVAELALTDSKGSLQSVSFSDVSVVETVKDADFELNLQGFKVNQKD